MGSVLARMTWRRAHFKDTPELEENPALLSPGNSEVL